MVVLIVFDRLQWSKPNESATKTVLSSSIRLHQMEELVAKKDAEIEILRHHLMKAHRTNDLLVKQLDKCVTVAGIRTVLVWMCSSLSLALLKGWG